jgi:hypothetical protein
VIWHGISLSRMGFVQGGNVKRVEAGLFGVCLYIILDHILYITLLRDVVRSNRGS